MHVHLSCLSTDWQWFSDGKVRFLRDGSELTVVTDLCAPEQGLFLQRHTRRSRGCGSLSG